MNKQSSIKLILVLWLLPLLVFSQKIAVIGDFRSAGPWVDSVGQLVRSWNPDAIVTTGDNFDLSNGTLDDQVGKNYSSFIYPYIGSYIPGGITNTFFPCLGNHDLINGGLQEYLNYFTLPANERYYRLMVGSVVFFIINSNDSESDGDTLHSIQANWLRDNLSIDNGYWKIVIFHHPAYSSGPHGSDTTMQWPFEFWGADAVISGHDHGYERLLVGSIPYIVNGAGGAPLYSFVNILPESQMTYYGNFGAMQIIGYEKDSLNFRFYNIRDSLIDNYTLHRTPVNNSILISDTVPLPEIILNGQELTISNAIGKKIRLSIFNLEGKEIWAEEEYIGNNKFTKNIPALNEGIFFLHVTGNNFSKTKKLVIPGNK